MPAEHTNPLLRRLTLRGRSPSRHWLALPPPWPDSTSDPRFVPARSVSATERVSRAARYTHIHIQRLHRAPLDAALLPGTVRTMHGTAYKPTGPCTVYKRTGICGVGPSRLTRPPFIVR